MDVSELLTCLEVVPPLHLQAVELIIELSEVAAAPDTTAVELVIQQEARIERAINELAHQADQARELTRRCTSLTPVPAHKTPPGF